MPLTEPHTDTHLHTSTVDNSQARGYDTMKFGGFLSTVLTCSLYPISDRMFKLGIT